MPTPLRKSLRDLAEIHDEPRFRYAMRTISAIGFAICVITEVGAYITPAFPKDTAGSLAMGLAFLVPAVAAHVGVPRRWLGVIAIATFAVLGWYLARTVFKSGGMASPHRDALYVTLAGGNAVLAFSVIEFGTLAVVMTVVFIATAVVQGGLHVADFGVSMFYVAGFVVVSGVGIMARNRLQRSELAARAELEELNENLEAEVERQVERIQRAQMLSRYLPPEIGERVLAGQGGPELARGRREVAVLCAVPFGLLESLNTIDDDDVVPLVNGFVSEMARLAYTHGGVIERFVGPSITVLFGAVEDMDPHVSARRAADMAIDMQRETNELLGQWEAEGHSSLRLRMGIGVAAGSTVVGTFGSERRVEYSALGDAMVRAHKLAHVAIPGEVRFDEVAAERVGGAFDLQPAAAVELTPGVQSPTFVAASSGSSQPVRIADVATAVAATATFLPDPVLQSTVVDLETDGRQVGVAMANLQPGSLFDGRYRIEERIGRGGMAEVYRARHVSLNQERALKVISSHLLADGHAVEQFRHEAEATARIHHPNVVRLYDFGRSLEGHYYLVLELVRAKSLAHLLHDSGALEPGRAVEIAIDVLSALQTAHALRLVHRDVKPANVLIDEAGRVRVTDFGLAQPLGIAIDPTSPRIVGTPAYMSPEQCQGKPLDGRSDLYSFGVMFYEMLCGALPYQVDTQIEMLQAVVKQEPRPLIERAPHLSPALWPPIARCLRKDPMQRPRSALEVQHELEQWYGVRESA